MKIIKITAMAMAAAVVAGCAVNAPQCGPGSQDAGCAPTTTAPAGESREQQEARLNAFEQKLNAEIQAAEQGLASAVAAGKSQPAAQRARNPLVKTTSAPIQDSKSPRIYEFRVLDTASIDMPLAGKGRPAYVQAMDEIKTLANQLADSRGSAVIIVDQSSADIRAKRVNTKVGVTQTAGGNPVTVEKVSTGAVARGIERYTIKPGEVATRP